MKLIIEIPDAPTPGKPDKTMPAPEPTTPIKRITPPSPPPLPPAAKKQSKEPQSAATKDQYLEPKPEVPAAKSVSAPQAASAPVIPPSTPAAEPKTSLHSFDNQGGTNDIVDEQKDNPRVFQFVQPRGDA